MANTNCLEGVACPKCKQEDAFKIEAKIFVHVTDEGTEDLGGDYEWHDDAICVCDNCKHTGRLREFKTPIEQHMKAYDAYFDECERANKTPLSFYNWKKEQR